MAVNPERVNELLEDFHNRTETIVNKYNLGHHGKGTGVSAIESVKTDFVNNTMSTFTLPNVSEDQIIAEMNVAIVQIESLAKQLSKQEAMTASAIGSAVTKQSPADSSVWNSLIMDAAERIEKICTMYADQINNMPKSLRARIDDDFAQVLDSINDNFNENASPSNANIVAVQVKNSLDAIERNLDEAATAVMKASIESIIQSKLTQVQEKEIALSSVEKGMTKAQRDGYQTIIREVRTMITDLGKSNYLVYDKVIRTQKIANIDHKLSILETIRVNAAGVSQSLSGYFGNTSKRRTNATPSIGGIGTTIGHDTSNISGGAKNFRNGIPPGFAGFAGTMTKSDIANKHDAGTAQSHIDAMHHYMSKGMSFEEAHNKANREGYTPASHDKNFGGGGQPFRVGGLGEIRDGDHEDEYIFPVLQSPLAKFGAYSAITVTTLTAILTIAIIGKRKLLGSA